MATTMRTEMQSLQRILNEQHRVSRGIVHAFSEFLLLLLRASSFVTFGSYPAFAKVLHSNAAAGNESGALQSEIQGARQRQHVMTPQCLGDVLRLSSLGVSETADYG